MKTDLTTAIVAAIIGVIVAYLITGNLLLPEPKAVNIKTLTTSVNSNLDAPDPEIFNYRALNPTVEVYVDCSNYDANGSCLDGGNQGGGSN